MFSGAADLGGEALGQFLQAAGIFQFDLCFASKELLQVLQQLDTRLRLLLQAFELLHQLVADLCSKRKKKKKNRFPSVSCANCCHNNTPHVNQGVGTLIKRSQTVSVSQNTGVLWEHGDRLMGPCRSVVLRAMCELYFLIFYRAFKRLQSLTLIVINHDRNQNES